MGSEPLSLTVVMVTRDRRDSTLATIDRLRRLPERPPVIVVDNASLDGTADAVANEYADVTVVRLPLNMGAAGRNAGVAMSGTPYVAFSDDDSWWAPGALTEAVERFGANPRLGVLAARVLVGANESIDPVCESMAASPIGVVDGLGRSVLGFVACGAVVRREAFLGVGGFRYGYGIGGEEDLLAIDMAAAGWDVCYCPEVVAHHYPDSRRPPSDQRRRLQTRNALRTCWLRRRPAGLIRRTAAIAWSERSDPAARRGMVDALGDLRWIRQDRRPVSRALEKDLSLLA